MADQKHKYDAALLQHQQQAAAQQQKLSQTTQQLQEVQQQLQEALVAAGDVEKQRDDARQLHAAATEQLNALSATHKVRPHGLCPACWHFALGMCY